MFSMKLFSGLQVGRQLGIEPIISADEMADPDVEHLAVMAYVAAYSMLDNLKVNPAKFVGNMNNVVCGIQVFGQSEKPDFLFHHHHLSYTSSYIIFLSIIISESLPDCNWSTTFFHVCSLYNYVIWFVI